MQRHSPVLDGFYDLTRVDKRKTFTIWRNCFRERIDNYHNNQHLFPSHISRDKVEWEKKPQPSISPTVEKIIFYLVNKALLNFPDKPTKIKIRLLGDGHSTAFLILATLYAVDGNQMPKRFVIKADENPSIIEAEFLGYQTIQQKVKRDYYLPLAVAAKAPVEFRKDYWAAFVMENADGMSNLLNQTILLEHRLSEIYNELFRECLYPLYKPVTNEKAELGVFFKSIVWERAIEGVSSLEPYYRRMEIEDPKTFEMISTGRDFITNRSLNLSNHIQVSWAKYSHGDLNCRNILLSEDLQKFILVDFPFSKNSECLAKDFVRAETELLLFLFEKSSGRDTDIELVSKWLRFLESNEKSFLEFSTSKEWPEANRIIQSIKVIRQCYLDIAIKNEDTEKLYYWYLISRYMLCLNFNYIPASKRLLGLAMISRTLSQVNY